MFRIRILEVIAVDVLNFINGIVNSYGLSIIIMTILVRLIILPLTLKQEKSMKKMKELQPKIEAIKEKYKNDNQKIGQETMKLYQENNVNPMSGCLPILIQMPIFFALYTTFIGDAIPSTASFLWFNLKQPDKLFTIAGFNFNLLPILFTLNTFIQQKQMSSLTGDSSNENKSLNTMMYTLPLMMLFIFYNIPSGVTLYYFVSGFLGLIQQYIILKGRNN